MSRHSSTQARALLRLSYAVALRSGGSRLSYAAPGRAQGVLGQTARATAAGVAVLRHRRSATAGDGTSTVRDRSGCTSAAQEALEGR
jgi:hypothetical protein